MRRKPFQHLAAAVLLLVLVVGEALATVHSLDLDAHTGGDPCKICISVGGLDAGAPASTAPFDLPRVHGPIGFADDGASPAQRISRPSARGPPLAS